jgi:hypothetical protein
MERLGAYTGFWWGNLKERAHLGDPDIDEKTISRWIFMKWNVRAWTGLIRLRMGDRWRAVVNAVMNLRVT